MTAPHSSFLSIYWRRLLLLVFWAFFVVTPFLIGPIVPRPHPVAPTLPPMYPALVNLLAVGIFYLNVYVFIPRVLKKHGVKAYLLVAIGSLLLIVAIAFGVQICTFGIRSIHYPMLLATVIPAIFFLSISTTYKVLDDYHRREQAQKERENERLKSELAFLRSQISPHFLFNVLNSIVSLARLRPEAVEPVTIQLAGLMRYMLYDSDEERVPIEREVSYLEDFVNLEKMRLGHKVQVSYQVEGLNKAFSIEPMLLIPFVENAFKHGTGWRSGHPISEYSGGPAVEIVVRMIGTRLWFNVRNKVAGMPMVNELTTANESVNGHHRHIDQHSASRRAIGQSGRLLTNRLPSTELPPHAALIGSGIGLRNVERRLKLLYPDHHLEISHADGWYEVSLLLELR